VSCIAGVYRHDGVSPAEVEGILAPMHGRAPHGLRVHSEANLGFGFGHLRTGDSAAEAMPALTLDGQTWITADARIDGRESLIAKLRRCGHALSGAEPHAALILHAYRAYGDDFLEHLIGDFAFAIWDAPARRLLCARDHFGIRPLHYVHADDMFAFASDPAALLVLPEVSRELDDTSVADFLLFGTLQDADRSMYRDVHALAPAHLLEFHGGELRIRRYWQGLSRDEIRYSKRSDYVDHFAHIFQQAVTDRCPGGSVAVQLSGGMDSTSIASATTATMKHHGHRVTAYHISSSGLIEGHDEQAFAELAANHLGLPLVSWGLGRYAAFERLGDEALRTSCPIDYPCLATHRDIVASLMDEGCAVVMSGQGGDAVLAPDGGQIAALFARGEWSKLMREVVHHACLTGSIRGLGLRAAIKLRRAEPSPTPPMPQWLEPAFAERSRCRERWELGWRTLRGSADPVSQLNEPWTSRQFEATELLNLPIVARYPFFDLRLIEYLLAAPNFVRAGKWVLRQAMRAKLPASVVDRPKQPLPGNFKRSIVSRSSWETLWPRTDPALWGEWVSLRAYRDALDAFVRGDQFVTPWVDSLVLAPLAFGHWLRDSGKGKIGHESSV
jgi:asparagine synthase (glutamine-hydrolysing)